jgi:hypothetical protein
MKKAKIRKPRLCGVAGKNVKSWNVTFQEDKKQYELCIKVFNLVFHLCHVVESFVLRDIVWLWFDPLNISDSVM